MKIFNKLLQNLECTQDDLTGVISFNATYKVYYLSFFGMAQDNFDVICDYYSKILKDGCVYLDPTTLEIEQMQEIINNKVIELQENEKEAYDVYKEQGLYGYAY